MIPLSIIKYGNNNQLSNIFDTLVNHNAYLSHRKFESHKEHSIGIFSNINSKVTLRDNLRPKNQNELTWIYLNDEKIKPLIHIEKDSNENETDRIIIPAFDLYGKEVGNGNGRERITTHAYEIRTSPKNTEMLKNLLCKISNEENTNLKFILYGIHTVFKTEAMCNIILQHNIILKNIAIVSIVNIQDKDVEKVKNNYR